MELVSASPGEIDPREEVSLLATASLTTIVKKTEKQKAHEQKHNVRRKNRDVA